ncbi:hypothetical protein [Nocardia sp. CNY236]|uniref:hypothetical protein n=1 Tax=Nocardia sp. CNY236 TaxID=1169152 RepID=UPI0004920E73|nr:hypothetical protein [Nocardia sp. CNY236]
MNGGRYLQHSDGTWEVVGDDGWPVPLADFVDIHAVAVVALAAVDETPVDERLLIAVRRGLLSIGCNDRAKR